MNNVFQHTNDFKNCGCNQLLKEQNEKNTTQMGTKHLKLHKSAFALHGKQMHKRNQFGTSF